MAHAGAIRDTIRHLNGERNIDAPMAQIPGVQERRAVEVPYRGYLHRNGGTGADGVSY